MRSGVLKKNESNRRSAPSSQNPRKNSTNPIRLTWTAVAFSGENQAVAARRGRRAGVGSAEALGTVSAGSVGESTEVIELRRQFMPEGVIELPERRQVVNAENVARPRDLHPIGSHDAAGPGAHQHHPVGKADRLGQI